MAEGRVLIVDDDAEVRKSIRLTLETADYEVVEAGDSNEAIQVLRSDDNPLLVDTIVCDLVITQSSHTMALAYLRSQFPKLPVLVLTDDGVTEHAAESFRRGVVDYILKPLMPETLLIAVKKAVNSRRMF